MSGLGTTIGQTRTQANTMEDSLTGTGEDVSLFSQAGVNIYPEIRTVMVTERGYDVNSLYGYAIYGTSSYTSGTSFILGHPTKGILGTSPLGGGQISEAIVRVLNRGNQFYENFDLDTFIDTVQSTGTLVN